MREKYSFITYVFSNTKPQGVPKGVRVEELDREQGAPYKYKFSSRKYHLIRALAERLESENITYTSRVADRKVWYGKWINDPKKSFSYRLVWIAFLIALGCLAISPAPKVIWKYVNTEEDPKNPEESLVSRIMNSEKMDSFMRIGDNWLALFQGGKGK